jgi:hypothetical protein
VLRCSHCRLVHKYYEDGEWGHHVIHLLGAPLFGAIGVGVLLAQGREGGHSATLPAEPPPSVVSAGKSRCGGHLGGRLLPRVREVYSQRNEREKFDVLSRTLQSVVRTGTHGGDDAFSQQFVWPRELFAVNRFYGDGLNKLEPKGVEAMPCPEIPELSERDTTRLLAQLGELDSMQNGLRQTELDSLARQLFKLQS